MRHAAFTPFLVFTDTALASNELHVLRSDSRVVVSIPNTTEGMHVQKCRQTYLSQWRLIEYMLGLAAPSTSADATITGMTSPLLHTPRPDPANHCAGHISAFFAFF